MRLRLLRLLLPGLLLFLPAGEVMGQGAWTSTGQLHGRTGHTATLLQTGQVLVTGGRTLSILDTAEQYDPAAGAWTLVSPLSHPRTDHTATLLPNGKVLVVGGRDASGPLATAELFDPKTRTFASTGLLAQARYNHTATLLSNGKVLVVGGTGSVGGGLSLAEIYDPATSLWLPAGTLTDARVGHTATLLGNGNVLVAGGGDFGASLDSVEIYNPTSGARGRVCGVLRRPIAGTPAVRAIFRFSAFEPSTAIGSCRSGPTPIPRSETIR